MEKAHRWSPLLYPLQRWVWTCGHSDCWRAPQYCCFNFHTFEKLVNLSFCSCASYLFTLPSKNCIFMLPSSTFLFLLNLGINSFVSSGCCNNPQFCYLSLITYQYLLKYAYYLMSVNPTIFHLKVNGFRILWSTFPTPNKDLIPIFVGKEMESQCL